MRIFGRATVPLRTHEVSHENGGRNKDYLTDQ